MSKKNCNLLPEETRTAPPIVPPPAATCARADKREDGSFSANQMAKGGRTTFRPPSNVKTDHEESILPLASGIDSLYLAIDLEWPDESFFQYLSDLKSSALEIEQEYPGLLPPNNHPSPWPFTIKPYGGGGYEWLLGGKEFALSVGNWLKPKFRPSVLVKIHSETLWHVGPQQAVDRIIEIFLACGAYNIRLKTSRVDPCLDLLLPERFWTLELLPLCVTFAQDHVPYFKHGNLTGLRIGSGDISARLYDKPFEIRTKSKKDWMFDIWGLDEVPENHKIIRVEFQLRREAIKPLGLDSPTEVIQFAGNLWSYCTKKWLKFQNRPGTHHTQRETLPWWNIVQNGFNGAQDAHPLIRAKAFRADKKQIMQQTYGLLSSLSALQHEERGDSNEAAPDLGECLDVLFENIELLEEGKRDFAERIKEKRAKYFRTRQKEQETIAKRRELGFPSEF